MDSIQIERHTTKFVVRGVVWVFFPGLMWYGRSNEGLWAWPRLIYGVCC